jgi:hypothetical protein
VTRVVLKYPAGTFDADAVLSIWGQILADASAQVGPGVESFFRDAAYLADHAVYQMTTIDGYDVVTLSGLFRSSMASHAKAVGDQLLLTYPDNGSPSLAEKLLAESKIWGPKK